MARSTDNKTYIKNGGLNTAIFLFNLLNYYALSSLSARPPIICGHGQ